MPTALLESAPAARTFAKLLQQLHRFIAEGKGDSDEADSVRDEMDAPWYAMTETERERVGGLSEDLYSLADGGVKAVPLSVAERKQWGQEFARAYDSGDWDHVLKMLRRPPSDVPLAAVAFLQARCWEHLGDLETALLFLREAEHLDAEYVVFVMLLLQQLNRNEEAVVAAWRILDTPAAGYEALYQASGVLLGGLRLLNPTQAAPTLERLEQALRRALALVRAIPPKQRSIPETEPSIVCMLGLCRERLGRTPEALEVYDEFLARYPVNSDVLTFRGLARYDTDRNAAFHDFQEVVQFVASSVWPYLLLAQQALERRDYNRCLWLCQGGLGKTTRAEVLAQLHEWIGMSRTMLGYPVASIRESFELAQRLNPENRQLVHNRAVAENMMAGMDQPLSPWQLPGPRDIEQGRQDLLGQQQSLLKARLSEHQLVA